MADTPYKKIPQMGERTKRNTEMMLSYCKAESFVVFDRESTHFQPNDHYGKMIELSAVKVVNDQIVDTFDTLINPEIKISSKITELTGITNEMVQDAPTYQQVVIDFLKFCEGSIIVAHNALPDINFVNYFSSKVGIPFQPQYIDTINLCKYIDYKINPAEATTYYNLGGMAEKYGIENDSHHRALNDTIVTAKLFIKLKSILANEIKQRDFQYQTSAELDTSDATIGSIGYWEKEIKGKLFQRVYVRLILGDKTNEVYYDFSTKSWGIKRNEFKILDFSIMTKKIKGHLNLLDEKQVYEIGTYKKG